MNNLQPVHHLTVQYFLIHLVGLFDLDQRFINYNHSEFVTGSNFASVSMGQNLFSLQGKLVGDQLTLGSLFQTHLVLFVEIPF